MSIAQDLLIQTKGEYLIPGDYVVTPYGNGVIDEVMMLGCYYIVQLAEGKRPFTFSSIRKWNDGNNR